MKKLKFGIPTMRWLMLGFLGIFSLALAGCGGSSGANNGTIEGFVVDSEDNSPIANVLVLAELNGATAASSKTRQTLTDGTGHFVLTDINPGVWTVGYQKLGFETVTSNVASATVPSLPPNSNPTANVFAAVIENGESVTVPTAQLRNLFTLDRFTIRSDVRDGILGTPVDNFTVTINGRFTKTFTNAQFKSTGFTGIAPGRDGVFLIRITHPDYAPTSAPGSAQGNSIIDIGTIGLNPLRVDLKGFINPEGLVNAAGASGWLPRNLIVPDDFPVIVRFDGKVLSRNAADAAGIAANVSYIGTEFTVTGLPVTAQTVTVRVDGNGYIKPGTEVTVNLTNALRDGSALTTPAANPTIVISTPIPLTAIRKSVRIGWADTNIAVNNLIQFSADGVNSVTQQTATVAGYVEDILPNIPAFWPINFRSVPLGGGGAGTPDTVTAQIPESESNPYVLIP